MLPGAPVRAPDTCRPSPPGGETARIAAIRRSRTRDDRTSSTPLHSRAATKRTPYGRCGHRRHPEVAPRPKRRVRAKVLPRPRHMPGVICRVTEPGRGDRFPPPIFVRSPPSRLRRTAGRPAPATRSDRPRPVRLPRVCGAQHAAYRPPPGGEADRGRGTRPEWAARAQHTAREATQRPPGRSATRGDCGSGTRWPAAPRHSRLAEARADPRLPMQPPAATSAQSAQAGARPHIPGARAAGRERRSAGAESGTRRGESSDARRMFTRGTFRATVAFL